MRLGQLEHGYWLINRVISWQGFDWWCEVQNCMTKLSSSKLWGPKYHSNEYSKEQEELSGLSPEDWELWESSQTRHYEKAFEICLSVQTAAKYHPALERDLRKKSKTKIWQMLCQWGFIGVNRQQLHFGNANKIQDSEGRSVCQRAQRAPTIQYCAHPTCCAHHTCSTHLSMRGAKLRTCFLCFSWNGCRHILGSNRELSLRHVCSWDCCYYCFLSEIQEMKIF